MARNGEDDSLIQSRIPQKVGTSLAVDIQKVFPVRTIADRLHGALRIGAIEENPTRFEPVRDSSLRSDEPFPRVDHLKRPVTERSAVDPEVWETLFPSRADESDSWAANFPRWKNIAPLLNTGRQKALGWFFKIHRSILTITWSFASIPFPQPQGIDVPIAPSYQV